jgi:hypothetical protein
MANDAKKMQRETLPSYYNTIQKKSPLRNEPQRGFRITGRKLRSLP